MALAFDGKNRNNNAVYVVIKNHTIGQEQKSAPNIDIISINTKEITHTEEIQKYQYQ